MNRRAQVPKKNCIGLLSNFDRPGIDAPSPEKATIRESGLWNTDCVDESYDPAFLDLFDTFVPAGGKSLAI
jgi:hypothetical protein